MKGHPDLPARLVSQVLQVFKDPQAPLEIPVTGVLLVVPVCPVLMVCQGLPVQC